MHVAVVGAGALGRVYGAHLADAGLRVTFVVRESRLNETTPFVIVRRNGDRRRRELSPTRSASIPGDADVVLLAVRADQLDESIERLLARGPAVPLVSLTPLLPLSLERVSGWARGRVWVAMPSIAASATGDGSDEYWAFRASPTLFEEGPAVTAELVSALRRSGLPARLSRDVRTRNPATTAAFFPISVAVSRAGGVAKLLRDSELTELGLSALKETLPLAESLGPIDAPLRLLLRAVGPRSLGAVLRALTRTLPEAAEFVDSHFGDKLGAQHRVLGAEIVELARERRLALPRLERLLAG